MNGDSERLEEVPLEEEDEPYTPSYEPQPIVAEKENAVTLHNLTKQDVPIVLVDANGREYQTKVPARGKLENISRDAFTPQIESLRANKRIRIE